MTGDRSNASDPRTCRVARWNVQGLPRSSWRTLTIKWSGVSPTTVTFKPGSIQVNNTDSGFIASGGSAKGSYATTSASFAATLASASSSALAKCIAGSGGVSSLQVTSGNATV